MKTSGIHIFFQRIIFFILLIHFSLIVLGQPDYNFTTGNLISGVDRQVNAQYRYNTVRANVDAKVTITAITGGITLSAFDGGSGFAEALQPAINIPRNSSGYVELRVDFFVNGTNLTVPSVQVEVPITPIDVDGLNVDGGKVNEFDQVCMPNGYYMFDGLGNEMTISRIYGGWWIQGTNTATIDYAGIDTMVKRVMFTVMNASVSSVTFRVGATNTGDETINRLRSVYFKKFNYPNPVLPITDLRLFNGISKDGCVSLMWELNKENTTITIELLKSTNGSDFTTEALFLVTPGIYKFDYIDRNLSAKVYYRLKMLSDKNFETQSNILTFKPDLVIKNGLKVYPSFVSSSFTATIKSEVFEDGFLEITDLNGRKVRWQPISLQPGINNLQVYDLDRVSAGSYFIVVRKNSGNYQSMIIKQ